MRDIQKSWYSDRRESIYVLVGIVPLLVLIGAFAYYVGLLLVSAILLGTAVLVSIVMIVFRSLGKESRRLIVLAGGTKTGAEEIETIVKGVLSTVHDVLSLKKVPYTTSSKHLETRFDIPDWNLSISLTLLLGAYGGSTASELVITSITESNRVLASDLERSLTLELRGKGLI